MFNFIRKKLFEETAIYSLVVTRIIFGAIMTYETIADLLRPNWLHLAYVDDHFRFKYYGFGWVTNFSDDAMAYTIFYTMAVCGILIMLGAFYRFAIITFTLLFSYVFLIDQINYLNHFYMVILFSFLLCFMPANRFFAVDVLIWPEIKTNIINSWPVYLLRAQMEIILIYAGLVKINYDWLHALPLKYWLRAGTNPHFLDPLFHCSLAPMVASYGTIILHILGAPLLLWKPARIYVFIIYCIFHVINSLTFDIGIFPWITIALTLIFFDTDWPVKFFNIPKKYLGKKNLAPNSARQKTLITFLFLLWAISQILIPLRNIFYPGHVLWTHEGHDFSWRMKLQDAYSHTVFLVSDNNNPSNVFHYTFPIEKHSHPHCDPDMILQFAHFLRDEGKKNNYDVAIHAQSFCSINRRHLRLFIDPNVDLAKEERGLHHYKFILPFDWEEK